MNVDIEVEVRQGPDYGKALGWTAVGLYVLWYCGLLWWVLAALALAALVWQVARMIDANRAAKKAIIDRADRQHQQVMCGDERGIYGTGYRDWRRYRDA